MATHNDFGKEAEKISIEFLQKNNYQILEKNWRYHKAEIDIIAIDIQNNQLAVIEVKARTSDKIQPPENAINQTKKKLIITATDAYISQKNVSLEVRFDVITLLFTSQKWTINHLKNAFNSYEQ